MYGLPNFTFMNDFKMMLIASINSLFVKSFDYFLWFLKYLMVIAYYECCNFLYVHGSTLVDTNAVDPVPKPIFQSLDSNPQQSYALAVVLRMILVV